MTLNNKDLPSILMVEDDLDTAAIIQIWLKGTCKTINVRDGNETLDQIATQYLNGKLFDLMLFDINIPYPWNGITLMKEIKNRWDVYNQIPFIAETAFALPEDRIRILAAGFTDYLCKPLSKELLVETISKRL